MDNSIYARAADLIRDPAKHARQAYIRNIDGESDFYVSYDRETKPAEHAAALRDAAPGAASMCVVTAICAAATTPEEAVEALDRLEASFDRHTTGEGFNNRASHREIINKLEGLAQ